MEFSKTRLAWAGVLVISLTLSFFGALRGGYIGPDYNTHFARLTEWSKVVDFSASNPPAYYLVGYGLFRAIGPRNAFPITLSLVQAGVNALALWCLFIYSEPRFRTRLVHLALVFFLTFLPVRVIHAATIGTDCTTIPLFVLVLFLFDKFLSDSISTPQNAALLGLGLGIANLTKYSFMSLLPAVLLLFICIAWKRQWKPQRFMSICALTLLLPSAVAGFSFWASSRVHGYNTEKHWLPKGMPADMSSKDLFSLKRDDRQLFQAPEYFKRQILAPHKHSYLALSHMGIFTDPMNLFQDLSVPQTFGSVLIPDQKTRRPWKTLVMQISMSMGTLWTITALIGTALTLWLAMRHLVQDKLEREDLAAILGTAFFLLMFLPIPFVHGGTLFGYWTPRLILPSLLYFFWAGFLLIDRKIARQRQIVIITVFVLALIQCTVEAAMLI